MLALVFSRAHVQHSNVMGFSADETYSVIPKFLQEVFILLCSNAEHSGDHLKQTFNFVGIPRFDYDWNRELKDLEDKDLSYHLNNNLFPYSNHRMNRELYTKLLADKTPEELDRIFERMASQFTYEPNLEALKQPKPCAETAMIDRAWNRLIEHKNFIFMLKPQGKLDYKGQSVPYQRYERHMKRFLGYED